jgi:valyl-tRNA synthetase
MEILVPMAGLIEPHAELERLNKRLGKAEVDLRKMEAKLSNAEFARNAPPEVVAKDHARVTELRTESAQLTAQIARVRRLIGQ